jgi:hypothetical protein
MARHQKLNRVPHNGGSLHFQVSEQAIPEQTSALFLRSSGREAGSFMRSPLALCACTLEAQVGQEGIGKARHDILGRHHCW